MALLGHKNAVGLTPRTVDVVPSIVIEPFRTVIASVEADDVVRAVVHAGSLTVVRQVIGFKLDDVGSTEGTLVTAGVYVLLLLGLLPGSVLVHREAEGGVEVEARAEVERAGGWVVPASPGSAVPASRSRDSRSSVLGRRPRTATKRDDRCFVSDPRREPPRTRPFREVRNGGTNVGGVPPDGVSNDSTRCRSLGRYRT